MAFASKFLDSLLGTKTTESANARRQAEADAKAKAAAEAQMKRDADYYQNAAWDQDAWDREVMRGDQADYERDYGGTTQGIGGIRDYDRANMENIMKGNAPAQGPSFFDNMKSAFGSALNSAALPGLLGAGGGITGYLASKGDRDAADAAMNRATDLASQMNYLQDPEVAKIQDNAAALAARSKALQGFQDRANMGLTPEEQAELKNIRNQQNQNYQAQQKQIQENMAAKGMQNSGAALAQMMGSSQAQNQLASQQADQTAAMSFAAKQNALKNLGGMGSDIIEQDFRRDQTRAGAKDQVSQFNVNQQNARNRAMQQAQAQQATWNQNKGAAKAKAFGDIGQSLGTAATGYQEANKKK